VREGGPRRRRTPSGPSVATTGPRRPRARLGHQPPGTPRHPGHRPRSGRSGRSGAARGAARRPLRARRGRAPRARAAHCPRGPPGSQFPDPSDRSLVSCRAETTNPATRAGFRFGSSGSDAKRFSR
jgi:hypothetical protein